MLPLKEPPPAGWSLRVSGQIGAKLAISVVACEKDKARVIQKLLAPEQQKILKFTKVILQGRPAGYLLAVSKD